MADEPRLEEVRRRGDGLAWLGAACLAAAWIWLDPVDLAPPVYEQPFSGQETVDLAPPLGISAGLALLGVGCTLLLGNALRRRAVVQGLLIAAAAAAGTAVVHGLLLVFEATRQPQLPFFTWIAWAAAELGGAEAAIEGRQLLLQDPQGALRFAPTVGLTGMRTVILFWSVGAILLGARVSRGLDLAFLRLLLIPIAVFGGRYALHVLHYAGTDEVLAQTGPTALVQFWNPWTLLLATLLSAALLAATEGASAWRPRPRLRAAVRPALLALAAGLALGAAVSWQDPGRAKAGRVLVDDRLTGMWEPAGRLLDTDRFGDFSAYSFSAMVEHLSHRYAVSVNGHRRYTRDYLDGFDVLVLKTPEHELDPEEQRDIRAWLEDGGGLFVISDHTDLMGMSVHLNALVEPYGIHFRFDATGYAATGGFDYWKGRFPGEHPISAGMTPFQCMTPCSIRLSGWAARPVMTLRSSASTRGDYGGSSHFGGRAANPADPQGLLVIAAAAPAGRGRLVAFSDSTVLSSFAYYTWSHADFVDRTVSWLNRSAPAPWLSRGFLAAGIAALLLSVIVRGGGHGARILAVSLGLAAGAAAAGALSAAALQVPEPQEGTVRVGFVTEGGHAWTPAVLGSQPDLPPHGNLMTFIQTPQRLGLETAVLPRDPSLLEDLDVLVLLNPDADAPGEGVDAEPSSEWLEAVRGWVRGGGRLVVTAQQEHRDCEHNLAPLYLEGLDFQPHDSLAPEIELQLAGDGAGRVILVLGSEFLDLDGMGHCMAYPGRAERRRYAVAYQVFGDLAGLPLPDRRTYSPY